MENWEREASEFLAKDDPKKRKATVLGMRIEKKLQFKEKKQCAVGPRKPPEDDDLKPSFEEIEDLLKKKTEYHDGVKEFTKKYKVFIRESYYSKNNDNEEPENILLEEFVNENINYLYKEN